MGTGPDDRFASRQSEDADVKKTADQGTEGSDYKIENPFMHRRPRHRFRLGTCKPPRMTNEIN